MNAHIFYLLITRIWRIWKIGVPSLFSNSLSNIKYF